MASAISSMYWTQNFGATGKGLKDPEALPPPTPDVAPEDPADSPALPPPPKGKKGKPTVPDKPPPPPDSPPDGPGMISNGG